MASGRKGSSRLKDDSRSRASQGRTNRTERARGAAAVPTNIDSQLRIRVMVGLFILFALLVAGRLGYLALVVGPANAEKAAETRTVSADLPAKRGTIYDRNGIVLATSVDATTIYCNPSEVTDVSGEAQKIASVLGGSASDYTDALTASDTSFAYIYRKADTSVGDQVKALGLDGIYFLDDTKRIYPCGQTAGQVVGMCDVDGNGLSGLELYYDDILKGHDGSLEAERGANGYPIAGGLYQEQAAQDGEDIVVSIDVEMQAYLEQRLTQCVGDIEGKNGNAILYDGSTGEIIAMASTPYLDPNDRTHVQSGATELSSISSAFEPGSIFKTASMSAVLESGIMTPDSTVYCPAHLQADEYYISDAESRDDETMSLTHILEVSSNVGMSLTAKQLGARPLYNALVRYNLDKKTGVDYPGESSGYCANPDTWSTVQFYNISFGQGIDVTPMQITRFYGALTDNGVEQTPHFLISKPQTGEVATYDTDQVIQNTSVIPELTTMLKGVVSEGTGKAAQISGFTPAGKTGTAEYAGDDGKYVSNMYNISFVGYLPNTSSNLVCFVGVTDVPGDRITTPAFKDIMTFAINHYRITPQ